MYDEEVEQALKESSGDKQYALFAENHRFQIPEAAHWDESDKDRVIIQLRSPKIVTETDAVSPACKIDVVLDPIEAVRLMGLECV